jgi:plastocyanin domain-containing protein
MANKKQQDTKMNHDIHSSAHMSFKDRFVAFKNWIFGLSLITKIAIGIIIAAILWFTVPKLFGGGVKTTYQTDTATRGTLIVTVTSSGNGYNANLRGCIKNLC